MSIVIIANVIVANEIMGNLIIANVIVANEIMGNLIIANVIVSNETEPLALLRDIRGALEKYIFLGKVAERE